MRNVTAAAGAPWRLPVAIVAAALTAGLPAARAQNQGSTAAVAYPSKAIRYVVPFGAGAAPDFVARLLGERLSRTWGQQVVVENRVGVAGTLGTAFVAKSPPDGYTLIQCNIASSAIALSLYAKVPYDQLRDLAAVTRIGTTPNVLTAHPSVPIRSVKSFIGYARQHPGKLSYSAGMAGESPQLSMELLKLLVKIDVAHVPFKIAAQGITETIGGQIPFNISNLPSIVSPVQTGRLRALATTGSERAALLPAVPTMREAGVLDYVVYSWYGVCAPAATPAPVLAKLHKDFTAVLRVPEIRQRLQEMGVDVSPQSPDEFSQFIRSEIARWGRVIKEANIPQQ